MRKVREILRQRNPKLEMDGEMQADTAWDEAVRLRMFPNTTLSGRANLFVMPNLDAANITYNMVRVMTDGVAIGPILMGIDKPAHILTPAATPRRVVNMTAIAAVDAQIRRAQPIAARSSSGEGLGVTLVAKSPVGFASLRKRSQGDAQPLALRAEATPQSKTRFTHNPLLRRGSGRVALSSRFRRRAEPDEDLAAEGGARTAPSPPRPRGITVIRC